MKNTLKNIGLLIVLSLYCFVISLYSGIAIGNADTFSKRVSTQNPAYNKAVTAGSFFHTIQSDISAATFNGGRTAPLKHSHNDIFAGVNTVEQLFSHRFSQYSFYAKNLLIRLQKTALIFPFHYFW